MISFKLYYQYKHSVLHTTSIKLQIIMLTIPQTHHSIHHHSDSFKSVTRNRFEGYTYELKVRNIYNIRCKSTTERLTMRQAFRSTQENSFPQRTRLPTHIKAMKTILSLPAVQQLNQYHPEPALVVVSCT